MGKINSREKILLSAKSLFRSKGYAATSMQEIANHAGINKGLLHYYFKSKDRIFHEVFVEAFKGFLPRIDSILNGDMPLDVKIRQFVDTYIDMLMEEPEVPAFIINELNTNPQAFVSEVLSNPIRPNPMGFFAQIEGEVMAGRIRRVSPLDLMLNMVSMCVFPFVARPLVQGIFAIPESGYMEMMKNRKDEIFNFIWNSIHIDVT